MPSFGVGSVMYKKSPVKARVFCGWPCAWLRAFVIRGAVASSLCLIFFPWYARGEDGTKDLARSGDTAQCRHGCCFAPSVQLGDEMLVLRGVSTFRYWGLRVYTGALYAPAAAKTREAVLGEIRKKLVLCYHRSLSPEQFRDKSQEVLEDTPGLDLATFEPFLSAINDAYVGVQEGDRYAITYTPDSGVMRLLLNEREPELVRIQSSAFARAYFGIWVSEYSVAKDFTAELLGEKVEE